MPADFPFTPAVNDEVVLAGITYVWNGYGWSVKGGAGKPAPTAPPASVPAGSVMIFYMATPPVGWTKLTTQNDKTLRVVNGVGGVAGGATPMSTWMAITATGSLSIVMSHMTAGTIMEYPSAIGEGTQYAEFAYRYVQPQGGGAGHVHPINNNLQYCDVIMASRDVVP